MRFYDIGANAGLYTESNLVLNPESEFILVEANPTLCLKLVEKFKDNPNVKVINSCVSDTSGKMLEFFLGDVDTISTASKDWVLNSRFSNMDYKNSILVESISIEDLIKTYGESDRMKIDVEGYEKTVILGISKHIGDLSFEWAEESKTDILDSVSHLFTIGYTEFCVSERDNYTFMPTYYVAYEDIKLSLSSLDPSRKTRWGMIFAK